MIDIHVSTNLFAALKVITTAVIGMYNIEISEKGKFSEYFNSKILSIHMYTVRLAWETFLVRLIWLNTCFLRDKTSFLYREVDTDFIPIQKKKINVNDLQIINQIKAIYLSHIWKIL